MDPLTIATLVLRVLPSLIQAGTEVVQLVQHTNTLLDTMQKENRDPTSDEWDNINKLIHDLESQLEKA